MYWGTSTVVKSILGIDARTPSASSIKSCIVGGYNCKCNVWNGNSDAFGVHDLIMYWGTGTVVRAMLEVTLVRLRRPRLNHVFGAGTV